MEEASGNIWNPRKPKGDICLIFKIEQKASKKLNFTEAQVGHLFDLKIKLKVSTHWDTNSICRSNIRSRDSNSTCIY